MKTPALLLLLATAAISRAELTEEQRRLAIEQDAPDANLAKIVLLAGSPRTRPGSTSISPAAP